MSDRYTRIDGSQILDDTITKDEINADVAGTGLVQSGDGSLQVSVDDSTLAWSGDNVIIKDDGVTAAKINVDVAGTALSQSGDGSLYVNVDDSTIEVNGSDQVAVKAGGITATYLGADCVDGTKIADDAISDEHLDAVDSPSDGEILSWSTATSQFEWVGITSIIGETYVQEADVIKNELPIGTINGSNTYFTIAHAPADGIDLFLNGQHQVNDGNDYTLSATGITYVVAPASGAHHVCSYIKD